MHYCQRCEEPHALVRLERSLRCPSCGLETEARPSLPIFFVTGASGAGKTTLMPWLVDELTGECIVLDGDWFIDPMAPKDGSPIDWDAVRDVMLHVAAGVTLNGLPTLILGSVMPNQLADLKGSRWIGEPHFLLLDCSDEHRIERIESRPRWRSHDVGEQLAFAHWLRENMEPVISTSANSPAAAASAIADWVRGHLSKSV